MLALPLTAATQAPHGVAVLVSTLDAAIRDVHPMGPAPLLLGLLALGFTRLTSASVRDNVARRRLLDALEAGDCGSISSLARAAGVSRKTAAYHLRILERARLVARRGTAGRPVFVAPAHVHRAAPEVRLLEHPARRAVYEAARARPGAPVPELARALGLKAGTAYFHARVLARAGLLPPAYLGRPSGSRAAGELPPAEPGPDDA